MMKLNAAVLVLAGMFAAAAPARAQPAPLRVLVVPLSHETTACPAVSNSPSITMRIDEQRVRMPEWILAPRDYAFLAIDENGNGVIDDATELVSNRMEGASALDALARRATAVQAPGDGYIDERHPLFARLLLWSDYIGNGRSDHRELRPLSEVLAGVGLGAEAIREDSPCRARGWSVRQGNLTEQLRPDQPRHPLWEVELRLDPAIAARFQGTTPVVSVTISARPSIDGYVVSLTNDRSRTIQAWQVGIEFEGGTGLGRGTDTSPGEPERDRSDGRIAPGETREIRFTNSRRDTIRTAVVEGVLFDDWRFEGRHHLREEWLTRRESFAAEAAEWIETLRAAAATPDPGANRKDLLGKLAEHRERAHNGSRTHLDLTARSVDDMMAQILAQAVPPDKWPLLLQWLIEKLERDRLHASRPR